MSRRSHFVALVFVSLLVLVVSAFHPLTARADDGAPPSPGDTTEPAPESASTEAVEPAAPVEADSTDPTEAPPVVDQAPEPPDSVDMEPSVPDILDQAPDGTEVVVLDSEGSTVPLVTEQAAEILTTSDPIWCPGTTTPGDTGCTGKWDTVTELIADLGTKSGDGTIYFTSSYLTDDVVFIHTDANLESLGALTIQGGWNGSLGAGFGLSGDTTFSVPMIINWDNDVTLNNLVFDAVSNVPASLMVDTTGNIVLNSVTVEDNGAGSGALLDNWDAPRSSITVNHSRFENNSSNGLRARSNGDITLLGVFASGNGWDGAYLDNSMDSELATFLACISGPGFDCEGPAEPAITVTSSIFNSNDVGLEAYSNGNITLQQVTAWGNDAEGAYLANTNNAAFVAGAPVALFCYVIPELCGEGLEVPLISVSSSSFTENGDGLVIVPSYVYDFESPFDIFFAWPVDVALSGVNASSNYDAGAMIATGGSVSITDSHFDYNTLGDIFSELAIDGGLGFLGFGFSGLGAGTAGVGPVSIDSSTFDWNDEVGLLTWSMISASLSNVDASQNGSLGAAVLAGMPFFLGPPSEGGGPVFGNIFIENSTFNANGFRLLSANTGLEVQSGGGDITINCSHFDNNYDYGVSAYLDPGRTLTTNGSTFLNNTAGDVQVDGGAWLDNPGGDCGDSGGVKRPLLAWNTIHVVAGESYDLDCGLYAGTILILPNGNRVVLPCPIGDSAVLVPLSAGELPGALDEQYDFTSAFRILITPALSHSMTVGFVLPAGQPDAKFTILHWDGSKWEDVGGSQVGGLFFLNTSLSGEFILVSV